MTRNHVAYLGSRRFTHAFRRRGRENGLFLRLIVIFACGYVRNAFEGMGVLVV